MMEAVLKTWDGREYRLPPALTWQMEYGLGSPCDSFQITIPWERGQEGLLGDGIRLVAAWQGERVFTGVVDECECRWDAGGGVAHITGRGMQALLLDNQAEAADYGAATLADILRTHVTPYGISLARGVTLPAAAGFSIASGSSRWQVVYQFARYHGGVTPRFDRWGRLDLSPWGSEVRKLGSEAPVVGVRLNQKRYGALSQVLVRDSGRLSAQTVVDEEFKRQGGCASRVLRMPRNTSWQSMRYNGQFQLARSQAERRRVEVTVAAAFLAWPGELIQWEQAGGSQNGRYRVIESCVTMDGQDGVRTRLTLGDPDAVL